MNEKNDSWWKNEMIELEWLFELKEDNLMMSAKSSCLLMMFSSCIINFNHFNHWKDWEHSIIECDQLKVKLSSDNNMMHCKVCNHQD